MGLPDSDARWSVSDDLDDSAKTACKQTADRLFVDALGWDARCVLFVGGPWLVVADISDSAKSGNFQAHR